MVFLCGGSLTPAERPINGAFAGGSLDSTAVVSSVQEDAVDLLLATRDGKISRKRNPFLYEHIKFNIIF